MKRTVSTISEGNTTEIQWSQNEPQETNIGGFVQVDENDNLIVPFWRNAEPFVFVLGAGIAAVYSSEDICADHSSDPVWSA
jgi:hypothetical protein